MSVAVPEEWLADLERRHLAELSFPEVRKGLQALSSLYVERRGRIGTGAAFDGAGKRAAFALFFGPLHFLVVREIVDALGAAAPPLTRVLDLGCGTGPAGAAWALAAGGSPEVSGVERSGWAVKEARETFRALGLRGRAVAGELLRERLPGSGAGIVLGWAVNELSDAAREELLPRLLEAARRGARVLVVEPIASRPVPWWAGWAKAVSDAGGRDDLWRFPSSLPPILALLDKAAGLDHRVLTARSLWLPGAG
ncbi:MAG TPA: class I SAM-dependent methyltransferase [Thermoanaerobaculia bacterium]|nr:class I SAM-dependent methyltransferase [Thermoanaerobaculia bacterium]